MFVTAQVIPGIRRDDECMATIMFAVQILLRNQDMTTAMYLARRRADTKSEKQSLSRTSLRGDPLCPPQNGVHANMPTTATVARPVAECSSLEDRLQKLERLMASKRSSSREKSLESKGEKRRGEAKLFSHRRSRDCTSASDLCDLVQVDLPDNIQRKGEPAQTLLNVSLKKRMLQGIRPKHPTWRPDEQEREKQRQWQRQTELEQERQGEMGREWETAGGRKERNKDTMTTAPQWQSLAASADAATQADVGQELNQSASLRRELEAALREKKHLQQGMEATSEECRMLHQALLARDEECASSKGTLRLAVHGHKMALLAHEDTVCCVCVSLCLCACSRTCLCIRIVCRRMHRSFLLQAGSLACCDAMQSCNHHAAIMLREVL